jgi:uncharacterized protein DUF4189
MTNCSAHGSDCKIVSSSSDSCAAVAAGSNKRYSVAEAVTGERAQSNALAQCEKSGGTKCEIQVWSCAKP